MPNLGKEAHQGSQRKQLWSDMDLFDLRNHIRQGASIAEAAEFLMQRKKEVVTRMRGLRLPLH